MKEFTEKDWQEVCERMNKIQTMQEAAELIHEMYQIYPINEMAKDRNSFIAVCCGAARNIHNTVANLICLSETICQDCKLHWRHELINFAKDVISVRIDKGVKRTAIAVDKIIDSYMDIYNITHYSYNDSYIYEKAMLDEIKKGEKPNATYAQKISAKQIKERILPNIEIFVEPNKERVSILFDKFIEA